MCAFDRCLRVYFMLYHSSNIAREGEEEEQEEREREKKEEQEKKENIGREEKASRRFSLSHLCLLAFSVFFFDKHEETMVPLLDVDHRRKRGSRK